MAAHSSSSADDRSSNSSLSLLGLNFYLIIGIAVVIMIFIVASLFIFCKFIRRQRRRRNLVPMITKEVTEMKSKKGNIGDERKKIERTEKAIRIGIDSVVSGGSRSSSAHEAFTGWGRWYTYKELEIATGRFSSENVIGDGGYGVVYRGLLPDNSFIAIKNLFNNKGEAEQEFKVEVEAIGKARHKNLVDLVGYCVEGSQRMLIYEYINNGNLDQWLRGDLGLSSPLTWDVRMKIAVGTAKGLAYLHEGLEPKVVHRDVKSSNILLDKKWNAKVSDFGLAKLLSSETSHVTTRVMGTFGYVAPEYARSGRLNENSDVYSFGVLLMEIISGRSPVDYGRPAKEVNLVDWFRMMLGDGRGEEMLDPRIEIKPSPRTLKRVLLLCLRCLDMNASKRPKMGQVVHMLQEDDFPYRMENASLSPRATPAKGDGTPFVPSTTEGR